MLTQDGNFLGQKGEHGDLLLVRDRGPNPASAASCQGELPTDVSSSHLGFVTICKDIWLILIRINTGPGYRGVLQVV